MQEIPKQRPHFPRILDSRRRAQEQSNGGPSKKHSEASEADQPAVRVHEETRSADCVDEQH